MSQHTEAVVSDRYRRFAETEAKGRSALYYTLAQRIADDAQVIGFLLTLPMEKTQPNLLLGSVRHLFGVPADWPAFRRTLLDNAEAVRAFMLSHSTQTNEPARCATLLPVLARLPQPLALIEVGASAGLCLLADCYGYDWGDAARLPAEPGAPMFRCEASAGTPLPLAVPEIVWRAGLDLNPLDAADPAQAAWLESLVWPEQTERLGNLRAALGIAARLRPRIVRGDLLGELLGQLCREAPQETTLVVFHTAVVAYVADPALRQGFAERVKPMCDYWVSNEAPGVFAGAPPRPEGMRGRFLLSVNGNAVAWTDPHGAAIEWIADADQAFA